MADEMKGVRQRVADALALSIAGNYCKSAGFLTVRLRETSELVDFPPNIQERQVDAPNTTEALKPKS